MYLMMTKAILFPKPVLIKPLERKKAQTINQMVPLPKPINASPVLRTPVTAQNVRAKKSNRTHGNRLQDKSSDGCYKDGKQMPCLRVKPSGVGQIQTISSSPKTMIQFRDVLLIFSS